MVTCELVNAMVKCMRLPGQRFHYRVDRQALKFDILEAYWLVYSGVGIPFRCGFGLRLDSKALDGSEGELVPPCKENKSDELSVLTTSPYFPKR